MFCRSLFVLLYVFFWPLCCLLFFDIQILINPFGIFRLFLLLFSLHRVFSQDCSIIIYFTTPYIYLSTYFKILKKMKNNTIKHHTVGTIPNSNIKIIEPEANLIPLAHIHTWMITFLAWYGHFNNKRQGKSSFIDRTDKWYMATRVGGVLTTLLII